MTGAAGSSPWIFATRSGRPQNQKTWSTASFAWRVIAGGENLMTFTEPAR